MVTSTPPARRLFLREYSEQRLRSVEGTQSASRVWDAKFGNFSRRAPVIITEWISGAYFCDADTLESTVQFIQHLQEQGIGLEVGVWDWTSGGFGSARWDIPSPEVSGFTACLATKGATALEKS
jgi:hypothetical protein